MRAGRGWARGNQGLGRVCPHPLPFLPAEGMRTLWGRLTFRDEDGEEGWMAHPGPGVWMHHHGVLCIPSPPSHNQV